MMQLPFNKNKYNLLLVDVIFGAAAFYLAFYFRFDGRIPALFFASFQKLFIVYALLKVLSFYFLGVYKRAWKYAGAGDLLLVVYALVVTILGLVTAGYYSRVVVPRSVFFITWMIDLMLSGGIRAVPKLVKEKGFILHSLRNVKRLLVIGAGDAGVLVVKELFRQEDPRLLPVGFIDDDPNKQHLRIMGLPVLGTRDELEQVVKDNNIHEVLIAMPSAPGQVIREIVEKCRETDVPVRTLPRMYDIINGQVSVELIREVKLEDLLGREPVKLDLDGIENFLKGKTVLVTGAGGSIGSELSRQICRYGPGRLILLGHDENPVFEIELELGDKCPGIKTVAVIADIKDDRRINQVFGDFRPQVVFHAAAHKHVPLMEHNPGEAYKNNVLGTKNVAEAADRCGTDNFILISTDKAVNPSSVMGATKRIAEMVIQGLNETSSTNFAAVRFGNVLGSRGSVIPIFQEQIRRGGPVTITHPEMCRYFMTIPEAVELVLQAASMAQGGEIFILDMGEPVKIVDMAKELIRLSGFEPEKDIEIKYVGTRPGEKLFEEILTDEEGVTATKIQRIFIARENSINKKELDDLLASLSPQSIPNNREDIFALLASLENNKNDCNRITAL
ncbi:MAG: nucleoside-diphosphate sugar epimerase/dehydratase [Peptococcaceae bacterium]|jgi:FlaA1/EpsC-like NDP-sugar epimerase|nr:polysaccharide biosynthesis protein [Peptococcaceae bacterium]MDH7525992.1 nucleoside-diphosphate sugar epimerase/dehydratase [Peptococcaceae bacterium]